MHFFFLLNTNDILKNVSNQTVDGPELMTFFFQLWKSMGSINCLVTDIHQNILISVQQKKETHTVNAGVN